MLIYAVTERYRATTCGLPTRDKSNLIFRVQWALFALAVVAVAFRFLARLPALDGVGYGYDDWAILGCILISIGSNVLLSLSKDHLPFTSKQKRLTSN
jgi:hypothetical protein